MIKAMQQGSVITVDNAVKTLALMAAKNDDYRRSIFPELLRHLQTCRPKDVAQHSESTLIAVNKENKAEFVDTLGKRMDDLSKSQSARVRRVIRAAS
jgi:hypothetical protein